MKDMVQKKYKALQLRKSGLSYREISKEIDAPKATVASWVQWVELTDYQKNQLANRLKSKQKQGRFSAGIALKARRIYREKAAYDEAETTFKKFINDPVSGHFFSYGLGLYSGKSGVKDETKTGRKNTSNFQFTTADPEKAKLIIRWVQTYLKIAESQFNFRVLTYESYRNSDFESLWSRILAVPRDRLKKTVYSRDYSVIKKPSDYRGSIAVTIGNINALRIVTAWQKLLIKYYKDTLK